MRIYLIAGAGVVVGLVIGAKLRTSERSCCARVGEAVSDKIGDKLGDNAQAVFDLLGGRNWSPALLDAFGVD